MLPELGEIKKKRKTMGITQTELSKKTGVSQSLIAKMESNAIVPSYTNARKIFDFFESVHEKHRAKAEDFMTKKIISVRTDSTIKSAIKIMEKNSVSQLPVINESKNLGTISEKSVLEKINSEESAEKLLEKNVEEIMDDAMPQISYDAPFEVISSILSAFPGVIVTNKGKAVGIITKLDLLKAAISKK